MRRREFIGLVGGAAAWPMVARAQSALPVIGFLHSFSSAFFEQFAKAVRHGLIEAGYVEGQNVVIVDRAAAGQYDRLPALASDLVQRKVVAILAAGGTDPVMAAKAATTALKPAPA